LNASYLVELGSPLLYCPVLGIGMGWRRRRGAAWGLLCLLLVNFFVFKGSKD